MGEHIHGDVHSQEEFEIELFGRGAGDPDNAEPPYTLEDGED